MKHRLLFFLLLSFFTHLPAQEWIIFSDTANYTITPRTDTINYDFVIEFPYPESVELDLDCDSINDLKAICFFTPVQFFPEARRIGLINLVGSELEILTSSSTLQAFNAGDMIHLPTVSGWSSDSLYELFYNHIYGPAWAGFEDSHPDPDTVNNMYLVFRKKKQDEYAYGWIKYSGKGTYWETLLYLQETAIQSEYCLFSGTQQPEKEAVKIYPNPVQDFLSIEIPDFTDGQAMWQIYSTDSRLITSGIITQAVTQLDVSRLLPHKGAYIFQLKIDGLIRSSRYLIRM